MSSFPLKLFWDILLTWYEKNKRDLPWRHKLTSGDNLRDPYKILVSELMLQQTQVSRVLPKFEYFISRWKSFQDLSQASLSDVLIAWKGLGYNRRAKHLLETAKIIIYTYKGTFPTDTKLLLALPGFGKYMTSALQVFALGMQTSVVDVNVSRVLSRVEVGLQNISKKEIDEIAIQSVPPMKADAWHQALMDFGATICTANNPKCEQCPLHSLCRANREAQQLGYTNFSEWHKAQPKRMKASKKDRGKKFEETDRYFRGRIIDVLRDGEAPMESVWLHLNSEHKLSDKVRFASVIESLVIDGLIRIKGNKVRLA